MSQAEPELQLPLDATPSPASVRALQAVPMAVPLPELELELALALLGAALAVMLARYSGQRLLSFAVAQPHGAGLRPLMLRLATPPDGDVVALLASVRQQLDAAPAAAPADVASAKARVEWLAGPPPAWPGGELGAAQLVLQAWPRAGGGVDGRWLHDPALIRATTVTRLDGHLRTVLPALRRAGPGSPSTIGTLPLVTADELAWLERMGEGAARTLPDPRLHQLIEHHAATRPDAIAVRHREQALSYAQLNARANQLARELVRRGVGAEVRVAVCVEPSLDIAVALLAIFKAGGVYVPVEPTYPAARIAAILDEAAAPVLLCADELATRLGLEGRPRLALTSLPPLAVTDDAAGDLGLPISPAQAASIYYTSGTTGRPKGVVATQANVTTYILTARQRYAISAAEVMPAIARFSFSISMFELMSPLAAGGTLVVLDRDHVLDLPRLAATLTTVTFFHMGPSLLRQLLPHLAQHGPGPAAYAGVRHASSGGDLVGPEVLEGLKRQFPAAEVFVIYGCSEISCMGLTYPAPRDVAITRTYVGRPFEDVAVRVVDGLGQRVPVGVVGEIQFAGGGLTRGYLDRAELTAEKFVQHDGRRWYRTGDLGRVSEDGWVEIAGRNDFQIKVRGMRLELAEVEVHLRRAPGVRDAVAMGKPGPSGETQLVAYVVPTDGGADGDPAQVRARAAAIRRYMVDHLPDYMVPAVVVELPRLPLNHNLKVDRFALPDPPAPGRRAEVAATDVPLTATEQALAQLWCRLLDLPAVSVADNFFDLGGESLGAQELIAAVDRQLGVRLLGMDVLRESLEVLAAICDAARGQAAPRFGRAAPAPAAAQAAITTFHFGDDQSLYGALHHDGAAGARAALICGAVGQEQVRAHFVLGRLARQLASRGVPTMRFDYHGVGDSPGHGPIVAIARWQRDVLTAAAELRQRTGARELIVVGARLGALLLESVREQLGADRIVLWDPVGSGEVYYQELAAMQRRHLAGIAALRRGRRARAVASIEALVGTEFTAAAIHELRRLRPASQAVVPAPPTARLDSRAALGYDCGWTDVTRMEDILSDAGFSRRLVALCLGEAAP